MEFIVAIALVALVLKVVDFLRYAKAGDANGVLTQLVVWIVGAAVVVIAARTALATGIPVGRGYLSQLGFWPQVFVGIGVASLAALVKDLLKSIDNVNSSRIPTLLPPGPAERRVTEIG